MTKDERTAVAQGEVPVHLYLSRLIDDAEFTNVEIARHLGYERPNIIAMMRTGTMKIPVSKVPALARVLGLDPLSLLQRVLTEYDSSFWETIHDVLGPATVTPNELALVSMLREQVGGMNPDLVNNKLFVAGFKALVGQALDEQVMSELAERTSVPSKRVTTAARLNGELEELCRQQALQRITLRRKLLAAGPH